MPGSYVSFESALAHHGWIPEAVFVTAGVTPGRKTLRFETTDFGTFSFHPLAIADYQFLAGVDRVQMGKLIAFVRSEEHTSELQSLMRISYAVFCLKKKIKTQRNKHTNHTT